VPGAHRAVDLDCSARARNRAGRDRTFKLRQAIQALVAGEGVAYSYVLVDWPPSLTC